MSDTVQLILTGHLLPGFTEDSAAENLARIMRLDLGRARQLLQNAPTVIKQNLPHKDVESYIAGLNRAGVVAKTLPPARPPADPAAAPNQPVAAARASVPDARAAMPARDHVAMISLVPEPAAVAPIPGLEPLIAAAASATVAAPPVATPAPQPRQALALVDEIAVAAATTTCPSCGREQPKRTLCLGCGTDMPRMIAARETEAQAERLKAREPDIAANPYARNPGSQAAPPEEAWYETPSIFSLRSNGRLGRMRYLAYTMVVIVAAIPLLVGAVLVLNSLVLTAILSLAVWWLYVRQTILRLHDLNLSGYWITGASIAGYASHQFNPTLGMVVAGGITLGSFALCVVPGSKDGNEYGAPSEPPTTWITVVGGLGLILSLIMLPFLMKKENLRHRYEKTTASQSGADSADSADMDSDDEQESDHGTESNEAPAR
ncbi:hypothetical protein IGB42_00740 [Andreprevotia sp. IGB-42]|uniref:DUF805 domain-containing protein n=1 Tax=Andreprevotia sp. IGB-42 TaxID=2497473 RepID=UPI00135BE3B4|nr:DUF805 domain-containing protein [Andreprevotia sp. IGB-42]KAF0814685.1 hypothetical protein IGB42_00740 [Andreprevotia sp. IGB-42]